MQFSQTLAECMADRGMSAYRLSKKIDVHPTTIRNWLDGKTEPKIDMVPKIAEALGVPASQLLGCDEMDRLKTQIEKISSSMAQDITKDIKKRLEREQPHLMDVIDAFDKLNEVGQQKAVERVEELTEIPKYQKK